MDGNNLTYHYQTFSPLSAQVSGQGVFGCGLARCVLASWRLCVKSRVHGLTKEQWREVREIAPPYPPAMHARNFRPCAMHVLALQPMDKLAIRFEQAIILPARNPEQAQALVGLGVQRGESG